MTNLNEQKLSELYVDSKYDKPSITIDAVVLRLFDKLTDNYRKLPEKKLQVYLTKRKFAPYKDNYAIIGTFIDLNFSLAESLQKCVSQKIGLNNFYYEQLFTFGEKTRDPRERVISTSYLCLTNENEELSNGEWFNIDKRENILEKKQLENGYILKKQVLLTLTSENTTLENELLVTISKQNLKETKTVEIINSSLAFDHIKIIYYGLERLKNKLEYTDIIFNLLPKEFTLTELKKCYELILDEHLLDANFRRKTSKLVSPTSNYVQGKGFRNSQLFTHNPLWNLSTLD